MTTALITGATAGIGAAFARRFAAARYDLVLVARNAERLESAATELVLLGAGKVEVLSADLATVEGRALVEDRLADPLRGVDVLVNNAGFGQGSAFLSHPIEDEETMLDVLVRAVLRLTRAALPGMIERGKGAVINVSSVAGFVPRGTYSSAKAWVTNFSESVAAEVHGTGVRVVAVCPGFTHTEFHERADIDTGDIPGWMWLEADEIVEGALRDLRRGLPVSVPSMQYKAITAVAKLVPRNLVTKVSRGMSKRW
jgi:short-subunit dehydrogenase